MVRAKARGYGTVRTPSLGAYILALASDGRSRRVHVHPASRGRTTSLHAVVDDLIDIVEDVINARDVAREVC